MVSEHNLNKGGINMDFSINTKCSEEEKNWNVEISGEIDIFNSTEFKNTLLEMLDKKEYDVKINCDKLSYIDSTGLGALITVLKRAKSYGGNIYLNNVRPSLSKLFKITNLDKVFIIEGEVNDEQ